MPISINKLIFSVKYDTIDVDSRYFGDKQPYDLGMNNPNH